MEGREIIIETGWIQMLLIGTGNYPIIRATS